MFTRGRTLLLWIKWADIFLPNKIKKKSFMTWLRMNLVGRKQLWLVTCFWCWWRIFFLECSRENPVPGSCDHLQNSAVALRHQQLSEVLSLKNSSPVYTYGTLTFLLSLTMTCFHFAMPYSSWLRGTVVFCWWCFLKLFTMRSRHLKGWIDIVSNNIWMELGFFSSDPDFAFGAESPLRLPTCSQT